MSSASSATASPVCDFESVQFSEQDTQQAPAAAALPATGATGAGLGQKALLAKKMAKNMSVFSAPTMSCLNTHTLDAYSNRATVSPTDNMMTPCTAKLTQAKKKHFNKYEAIAYVHL